MDLANDLRLREIRNGVKHTSAKVACELARHRLRSPKGSAHFEAGSRAFALLEKALVIPQEKLRLAIFDYASAPKNLGSLLTIGKYGAAAKVLLPELKAEFLATDDRKNEKWIILSAIAQIDSSVASELLKGMNRDTVRFGILVACESAPCNKRETLLTAFSKSGDATTREEATALLRIRKNFFLFLLEVPLVEAIVATNGHVSRCVQSLASLKPVRNLVIDPIQRRFVKAVLGILEDRGASDIPTSLKNL